MGGTPMPRRDENMLSAAASVGIARSPMTPIDDRSSRFYHAFAAAVSDPVASQNLGIAVTRALNDWEFAVATFGAGDAAELRRFLQVADAFLRGQNVQTDMMQENRQMFILQMGLMREQAKSTHEIIERFKKGMRNALEEAEMGYRVTKWMYIILFALGIIVFVTGGIMGLLGRGDAWSVTLGIVGGAATLTTLLFGQQKALESSRADLMQLEIAVFSWLDNSVRLSTSVQSLTIKTGMTTELLQELWKQSHRATADVLDLVQTYCEARPSAKAAAAKSAKAAGADASEEK
ncbi:MAG: hypothetical protein ABIZ81_05795 [Opitutaceae bacterium]